MNALEQKDEDVFDLKDVISKPAAERQRWLSSVLKAAKDGRLSSSLTALFDILAHRKFVQDLNVPLGRRMRKEILSHASLFSGKQQKFLHSSGWPMEKFFGGGDQPERRKTERQQEQHEPSSEEEPTEEQSTMASKPAGIHHEDEIQKRDFERSLAGKPAMAAPEKLASESAKPVRSLLGGSSSLESLPSSLISRAMAKTESAAEQKKSRKSAELAVAFGDSDDEPSSRRQARPAKPKPRGLETVPSRSSGLDVPRTLVDGPGGPGMLGFTSMVAMKRRAVSNKNPGHEGLEDIKAQVLAERGIFRHRSRSRRRRSRSRSGRSRRDTSKQISR